MDPTRPAPAASIRVLFVCTANLCRSPMAELLLRDAVAGRPDRDRWSIGSAGTRTRGGRPVHPSAAAVLAEYGIDSGAFVSRSLTRTVPRDHDLVLTATRVHRADVVRADPPVLSRVFTIRQFAYLLDGPTPAPTGRVDEIGPAWLSLARASRADRPGRTDEDDIPDPVDEPIAAFRQLAVELVDAFTVMLRSVPPQPG